MSHITTVKTEFRNVEVLQAACRILQVPYLGHGQHTVYNRQVNGHAFQLRDWNYPCVVDVADGSVTMDNSQGNWGDIAEFNTFQQRYGVEAAKLEASRLGFTSVKEQSHEDGRITLLIDVPEQETVSATL